MDKGVDTRLLVFEVLLAAPPPCPRRLKLVVVALALRPDVFTFVRAVVFAEDGPARAEDEPARAEDEPFGFWRGRWDVTETSDSEGDGMRSFLIHCQPHCTQIRKRKRKDRLFSSAKS